MKIAIIGNSHIGALYLAIRDGQFKADATETMLWGVPAHLFNTITYEGGHFRTPCREFLAKICADPHEALPVHDFDAIIFHGLILNIGHYLFSLRKMTEDLRCYSRAFLREGLQTCIEEAATYRLVRALRADYDRRVLMSPMPLMSEDSAQSKAQSIRAEEFDLLNSCIAAILADIRAEYVAQPSDTVRDSKSTKREFCVNSVRVFYDLSKHPDDDYIHMNGRYGARVLDEIAAQLSAR